MQRRRYSELPEDMVLEILSWLPAKSVGQCRCVSKSWRALLTGPQFIRTHLQKTRILNHERLLLSTRPGSLLITEAHHHVSDHKFTFSAMKLNLADLPQYPKRVRASCDGLVLVGDQFSDNISWLMNPITGEIREVPRFPFAPAANVIPWRGQFYGLGYDSASHDYKIVMVRNPLVSREMVACVYSLKCGSWKSVGNFPYYLVGVDSVFIHGCQHWCGARTVDNKPFIVTFDFLEEKFCELRLPKSCKCMPNKLGVLGGCLSVYV